MYEFMTKSTAKPGVTAKALHHIKKMYSTIAKLTASDLQAGHYDRWVEIRLTKGASKTRDPRSVFLAVLRHLDYGYWLRKSVS